MNNFTSYQKEQQDHSDCQDQLAVYALEIPSYFARKRIWSRMLAAVLLVLFAPVILVVMLIVRMTSNGPALFRQVRMGKDGEEFEVLKIRTMYQDAEEESGAVLCMPGDSRITPIGRILRFLHLDELTQLINVVRGEMCLIGPRPERPEIIDEHDLYERVPGFAERTMVLPGVTGLAQINLPPDQSPECVLPKVKLDLEYISNAGVGLDLRILLCTLLRMFGIRHGHAVRLFGLGREVVFGDVPRGRKRNMLRRFIFKGSQWEPAPQELPTAAQAAATVSNGNGAEHLLALAEASEVDVDENDGIGEGELDKELDVLRRVPR